MLEMYSIEINKDTELVAAEFEIGQKLRMMNGCKGIYGLYLNHD